MTSEPMKATGSHPQINEDLWEMRVPGRDVVLDCGWGRLIFGQTFTENEKLARLLCNEQSGKRDIAFYLRDPHVVVSLAPQEIFLDPSHTYRLWLERYRPQQEVLGGFHLRPLNSRQDAEILHDLYLKRQMIPPSVDFIEHNHVLDELTYLVAEDDETGAVIGAVFGVDHYKAFADPENGSSLWALVVDPQTPFPGIGEALVRGLAEHFSHEGRSFMDLSVMHDNHQAIALYEKLGFRRVIVFALKHKNPYNEPLFIAPQPEKEMNPYAQIIIKEARRRGIGVDIIDAEGGYFALSFGGRTITCRESLSELTSAVAMSLCDDKEVTSRLLAKQGLHVPAQITASFDNEIINHQFLSEYKRLVVKPARGEQGAGISVDIREPDDLRRAIEMARLVNERVLLEEYVTGKDLRIVVINFEVVAAAVRRPPKIIGDGKSTALQLIRKQSRRRSAATGGESNIPLDAETERCVREADYQMSDVLPENEALLVRKTANLHTGGTIHDVTEELSPTLRNAAIQAAQAINIPVVGLDFLVSDVNGKQYVIIEANERPGLANHEPQPTAESFIDLLFPQTNTQPYR